MKKIKLNSFNTNKHETTRYEGRLLGLITEMNFCKLIENPDLVRAVATSETNTLNSVSNQLEKEIIEYEGPYKSLRVVCVFNKRNNFIVNKKLFVSGIINDLGSYQNDVPLVLMTADGTVDIAEI